MSDAAPAAGGATRLAVLGSPIAHSRSPRIHRAAYLALGLDWTYDAIEVTGDALPALLAGLDSQWRGLSLTMPLKRDVLPLLAERDELVDLVGGANTVLLTPEGARGYNTDVQGTIEAFRTAGVASLSYVHVLGAGATAASVLVAVARLGAERVLVSARTPERASDLVQLGATLGIELTVRPWGVMDRSLVIPDAVISTLPGGQNDLVFAQPIRERSVLFDVAYDPWPSRLALDWESAGGTVISGLELLLAQAVGQVRVFIAGDQDVALPNEEAVVAAMRDALA